MKKILMGAIVLTLFAISFSLVQISCSKTNAMPLSPTQVNKILYTTANGSVFKLWIANYDGSNPTQINIALPAGVILEFYSSYFSIYLSPDGQKIFFWASNPLAGNSLYTCNVDGSNVQPVITSTTDLLHLYGAH